MKKIILSAIFLFGICTAIYAQQRLPPRALNKEQQVRQKRKLEENKAKYIQGILDQLNADDFQKEIIKQKLNSYFDEKLKIYNVEKPYFQREQELKDLDESHFKDLEDLVSKDVIEDIKKAIKGKLDKKKEKKKRKKKDKQ
ncbi:hypothetical protein RM697_09080 [Ichthyenterobacterium sp. W332]|uniref:Uncharacterized protein n=1 Tax=Microcosmobacter mediterraneus TaxID=3075607 RepID=A0ABU2YKV4_9FLAO|nr:hypothetical protein [Ichthyenterobacterium sp. W332]MDT0558800.1 hypothetical protein [Ichthyenterobacterium sp. W332]